jgi:DNA adenine methylase
MRDPLKAPFIWFGGKRRVAAQVWEAIGDVDNYVEPFAGSLAVLLGRPHDMLNRRRAETVNDRDMYLANFWRALAYDPEAVAAHADWPVNEADLFARHLWLVNEGRSALREGIEADPDWFDAKIAGWWCWGLNAWIGSGWCAGTGPWTYDSCQRPHLGNAGRGVNRQLPHLGDAGRGVNRQLPHLGNAGQGVNQPDGPDSFTYGGSGAPRAGWDHSLLRPGERALFGYFRSLAARIRDVRVCCGDWSRVVTDGALNYGSSVGVFLDPPYSGDVRTKDLYASDDHDVAAEVRDWAIAHGDDSRLRIVLAGYFDEHQAQMPDSWRVLRYSASAAYQSHANKGGVNEANRHNECLWFSPGCLGDRMPDLFSALDWAG